MIFKIVTKSTFENVYHIEAPSAEEAAEIVMNNDVPPDFYQKHLGEEIIRMTATDKDLTVAINETRKEGYI